MTYTAEGFNQFCYEATGQFLQTVVVIDNEAVFCEKVCNIVEQQEAVVVDVIAPPTGTLGAQQKTVIIENQESVSPPNIETEYIGPVFVRPPDKPGKNILKAKPLIDAFADKGVVCSIIRPDPDEAEVVERAIKLASVADIVVVDWALGKNQGESDDFRAKQIVKGIIERDLKKQGRLRLIAIYTAEDNPGTILEVLYSHINGLNYPDDIITKDEATFTIQNRFFKIAVLLKPQAGKHVPGCIPVDFAELPERLHRLFAELNRGLLPSVTLRAIASIREGTHHLLAVLHKDLDPALVGHRCLLLHPEDAEEFCEDLVSDEIRSILALKKVGKTYAGESANKQWIGSKIKRDEPQKYSLFQVTRAQAFMLVEAGEGAHRKFFNELRVDWLIRKLKQNPNFKDKIGKNIDIVSAREEISNVGDVAWKNYKIPEIGEKMIPQILHGKEAEGQLTNLEFSRLCSLKREAFGLRRPVEGWIPRLTLGTILQLRKRDGDSFVLCLQPRCDSVRLEKDKAWNFPFLILENATSKFNVVVKSFGQDDKPVDNKLLFEPKPRNQVVHQFNSITGNAIEAIKEDGKFIFQDKDDNKFFWVADLKDFIAQKIADELSTRVGSVGFDEYEWLRRKAR